MILYLRVGWILLALIAVLVLFGFMFERDKATTRYMADKGLCWQTQDRVGNVAVMQWGKCK